MIARLSGTVVEKGDGSAVIDVNGVGYRVQLSGVALAALPPPGERAVLRIHTHVREDSLQLFGFAAEEEQAVFEALIGVKGVGPRAALNILSGIAARDLARAVAEGDVVSLTRVPGVGKKTAERLVLELKDKLVALARAAAPGAAVAVGPLEQLEAALVGLGFKPAQAQAAVERVSGSSTGRPVEELLREALKVIRG